MYDTTLPNGKRVFYHQVQYYCAWEAVVNSMLEDEKVFYAFCDICRSVENYQHYSAQIEAELERVKELGIALVFIALLKLEIQQIKTLHYDVFIGFPCLSYLLGFSSILPEKLDYSAGWLKCVPRLDWYCFEVFPKDNEEANLIISNAEIESLRETERFSDYSLAYAVREKNLLALGEFLENDLEEDCCDRKSDYQVLEFIQKFEKLSHKDFVSLGKMLATFDFICRPESWVMLRAVLWEKYFEQRTETLPLRIGLSEIDCCLGELKVGELLVLGTCSPDISLTILYNLAKTLRWNNKVLGKNDYLVFSKVYGFRYEFSGAVSPTDYKLEIESLEKMKYLVNKFKGLPVDNTYYDSVRDSTDYNDIREYLVEIPKLVDEGVHIRVIYVYLPDVSEEVLANLKRLAQAEQLTIIVEMRVYSYKRIPSLKSFVALKKIVPYVDKYLVVGARKGGDDYLALAYHKKEQKSVRFKLLQDQLL